MMIVLIALALLAIVILLNEFYQQRLGVPCMPTMPRVRRRMLELAGESPGVIVELGSGWGGLARAAARRFPLARVTGLEMSPVPWLVSRLLRRRNTQFLRRDFFSFPLHDADVVLCYLTNPLMAKLAPKLKAELKPGARVVSSTFFIEGWEPETVEDVKGLWTTRIFVYRA
jgi:SAM-dependent methyltransferase